MATVIDSIIQSQLFDRREKLKTVIARRGDHRELHQLLDEVDAALSRVENGSFGICQVCQSEIEPERLLADPMTQFCLGDLTPQQQHSLEKDLELASLIQKACCQNRIWNYATGVSLFVMNRWGQSVVIIAILSALKMAASTSCLVMFPAKV